MYEDLYEVERSIDEPKFDAYISNGLDLHSVIPLSNGKESHYIIVDSLNIQKNLLKDLY